MIALSIGDPKLSYRLGVLAIKMIGKFGTTKYKSFIIGAVHSLLLWINDPFQLVSEMLSGGIECGRKSGDEWGVISCRNFSLVISYLAGEKLVPLKEKLVEFINDVKRTQHRVLVLGSGETAVICHVYGDVVCFCLMIFFQVSCIVTYLA